MESPAFSTLKPALLLEHARCIAVGRLIVERASLHTGRIPRIFVRSAERFGRGLYTNLSLSTRQGSIVPGQSSPAAAWNTETELC